MRFEHLNFHHLLYFWMTVREGSLSRAAAHLRLTHGTLSSQVRALERQLGEQLLSRKGRLLHPTEMGQLVFGYADELFGLARELVEAVDARKPGQARPLQVGITDALPKLVARRLLEPVLRRGDVRLVCTEAPVTALLARLALHELDLVLSDTPLPAGVAVKAFSHLLGESALSFVGTPALVKKLHARFPASLDGAPMLLPTSDSALRRSLDAWFDQQGVRPRVVAEVEDSALLQTLGQDGLGVFPVHQVVEGEVCRQYDVVRLARLDQVRERFYALSAERKVRHPAVLELTRAARQDVFAPRRAPG